MLGRICAGSLCKSNQLTLKKCGVTDVIFHSLSITKNMVSTTLQKEWIRRCKIGDKFTLKNFTENDYERYLENELLGLPLRCKLNNTALPSVNLNYPTIDRGKFYRIQVAILEPYRKKHNETISKLLGSNLDNALM